jgi:hypothetical protein
VGLYSPQQPFIASTRATEVADAAIRLAADAGLAVDTLVVQGGNIFAGFEAAPPDHRLKVLSATYGGNCGAPAGNVTRIVDSACDGRPACTFVIKVEALSDPAPGCAKDFTAVWSCGSGEAHRATVPAEAGFGSTVRLTCTP